MGLACMHSDGLILVWMFCTGIAGLRSRSGNSSSMYPAPLTDGGSSSRSAYAKPANRAASFHDSFVKVDYPAYPVLTPTDTSVAPTQVPQQYNAGSSQGYVSRCLPASCLHSSTCASLEVCLLRRLKKILYRSAADVLESCG